jgi:uncharacterized protein (TIGR00299 family) protein
MPSAYFDCQSGISGDMVLGGLVDAGVPLELLNQKIATLGIAGLRFEQSDVRRMGLRCVKIDVRHEPEHKHRHLRDIDKIIRESGLQAGEKELALEIFQRLGEAEAKVHGCDINKVHFHEVGASDSIADIVGVSIGLRHLGIEQADFSPLPVGSGFVDIAHGRVGLPAPATAELLRGVPIAASDVEAELTTPTGAAIARVLGKRFGAMPAMRIAAIGCGAGTRDLPNQPNLLRLFVGAAKSTPEHDQVVVMETNVDDVSPEVIGDCCERLRAAGALDVYTTAIGMKKNRPGVKITLLADPADVENLGAILFRHTRSLGLRRWIADRDKRARETATVATRFGDVAGKLVREGDGQVAFVPEFEACRLASENSHVSVIEVHEEAVRQYLNSRSLGG